MAKKFTKKRKTATPVTAEDKALARLRRQAAARLLKRRQRKSNQ